MHWIQASFCHLQHTAYFLFCFFTEFKKQLSSDISLEKPRKTEQQQLGELIREATATGKYYMGR